MSRLYRKTVAVLMLLWLPLSGGSALAATISMQLQQGGCHEMTAAMSHDDMGEHHQHHGDMSAAADEQTPSCNACGICHLACAGYLAVPGSATVAAQPAALEATPYLLSYISVSSAPLVPPPLVRA
ncbi:MAG TPA: DUF2946 family protein [Sideroxyarcus sp.]|nr:DUF2946 family protein [Sideroxyarcus sp.]